MNAAATPDSKAFSIHEHLGAMEEPHTTHAREKLGYVEGVLAAHGFPLRADSRLAFLWATDRLDPTWDAREVCHEMMSMQTICANTPYNDLLQPFMRALADDMKKRYRLRSWAAAWRIVREYAPDILKTICMVEAGMQIPNFVYSQGHAAPIPPPDVAPDDRTETTEGEGDGGGAAEPHSDA